MTHDGGDVGTALATRQWGKTLSHPETGHDQAVPGEGGVLEEILGAGSGRSQDWTRETHDAESSLRHGGGHGFMAF